MVLETKFEELRRDRRHKRAKGNGRGREFCLNLYHAAGSRVLNPDSKREVTCPDSTLPRQLRNTDSDSIVSVACCPGSWPCMESLLVILVHAFGNSHDVTASGWRACARSQRLFAFQHEPKQSPWETRHSPPLFSSAHPLTAALCVSDISSSL